MVAGRMTFRHPCSQQRDYILNKLIRFSLDHAIAPDQLLRNLDAAVAQLPRTAHREEAAPLAEELARVQKQRGAGPQPLGKILPAVLAKLGVDLVKSTESGEADPTERPSRRGPNNVVSVPKAQSRGKAWRSVSDHQRRIRLCGVTPLMYQYGET